MNDDPYEPLVRRAQAGDHEAFAALMARFQQAAQRWAWRRLGDADLAQDVAQEAFLTAYEHLPELREPAAFPGWLRQITLSRASRLTRGRGHETAPLDDDLPADADVEERAEQRAVLDAVRRLPEGERAVVERFYLDGYSQQEIADALALPLTTVKKRLQYARERLREAFPTMAHAGVGFDSGDVQAAWWDAALCARLRAWDDGDALPLGCAAVLAAG